ncbi:hypothetical protein LCGC14_2339710, partial [marine sediment metagenome]
MTVFPPRTFSRRCLLGSGLTALAPALGAGRLIPELSSGETWPFEAIGAGFGVLGITMI